MKKLLTLGAAILFMVYYVAAQQQLENPGFEEWEDVGLPVEEPVNWSSIKTSDNDILNPVAPIVWGKSDAAHSGNYCVELFNVAVFSIVATGTLTNGRVHSDMNPELGYVFTDTSDSRWNTPFTKRPDSLVGWLRFYPQENDVARVRAILHRGYAQAPENGTFSNWVGEANFISVSEEIDTWTRFSVPFTYYNSETPEYILMVVNSGDSTIAVDGSIAYYDDLELIYNGPGIDENPAKEFNVYFYNGKIVIVFNTPQNINNATLEIIDLSGRIIFSENITIVSKKEIPVNLNQGIYILKIGKNSTTFTKKLYIH